MRLNASALNSRSLNADRRAFIHGSGEGVYTLTPSLAVTRYVHGSGAVLNHLEGDFQASARRFARADCIFERTTELAPTVFRSGQGALVMGLEGSLYYTRTVQGFGSIDVGVHLRGDVGVVFGEGQAVMEVCRVDLSGTRKIPGAGAGILHLEGSLAPAAIRRGTGSIDTSMAGAGEASHITEAGVRYIGFASDAAFSLLAQDGGMLRQAFIGSMDMGMRGSLHGSLRKPTLAGKSVRTLHLACDFRVIRRGEGSLLVPIETVLDGSIYVRGEGSAVIQLAAVGTASKRTFPLLHAALITLSPELSGSRKRMASSAVSMGVLVELDGTRAVRARGDAVMELLGESEGFLNPQAEDIPGQTFARPAVDREFARPAVQREWRR